MATINTPVSVAEVAEQAGNYTYDSHIPLANWLRTASTMQKEVRHQNDVQDAHAHRLQAQVYEAEGNDAQTYLLLYRHADLVLQKLQGHPDRNKPENRKALNAATAAVNRDLKKLEDIAPRIKKRHEEHEARRKRQQDALKSLEGSTIRLEVARLQQNGHRASYSPRPTSQSASPYHYPTVPYKTAQERWSDSHSRDPAPARPPKEQIYRASGTPTAPPPLPPKPLRSPYDPPYEPSRPPPVPAKFSESAPPLPAKVPDQRPLTPSGELDEFTFKPSAFLENGDPLRPVFLPSQLRNQFLSVASSNTRLNLETCGMLGGILKSNALFITRLIIPEQTSTSDTCETLNEEELFDYCDKEELMVLGWIHTHPTQTCFMSSRDLHTHVGYQVMMPESIAIVCAPTKQPR
ncbi:endosome-associated ubiquitin isopeptidase [Stemphylium lycopersici]|nr:endosome-associated ubiquitin isopeptidase [Stemphylium lycopersici]